MVLLMQMCIVQCLNVRQEEYDLVDDFKLHCSLTSLLASVCQDIKHQTTRQLSMRERQNTSGAIVLRLDTNINNYPR